MMEALQYIVGSLAWSVFGFAAGAYAVTVQREVHDIKETVEEAVEPDHLPVHRQPPPWRHGGEHFEKARRRFGVLILILALVSLLQITVTAVSYNQQIDCQNRVNRLLREDQLLARARSAEDWAAVRRLLTAVEEAGDDVPRILREVERANDALGDPPKNDPVAYIADEC